jgi:hypothetical protein
MNGKVTIIKLTVQIAIEESNNCEKNAFEELKIAASS